jgi:hypothetical protein
MPWYWYVIILSVIVGPFEALRAYNRLLKRRQRRENERKRIEDKQS